jgi:predicted nucleic acid-binding protein
MVLLGTGPLVCFLAAGSEHYEWVCQQWKRLSPPLITCEAVLTEAAFLLKREGGDTEALLALLERGVLRIGLRLDEELNDVRALMRRYKDRPMSLADACLVRMSEMHAQSSVLTFDKDFRIYRRHGNRLIDVLMP